MSHVKLEAEEVQHKIGTCPACGCGIWADVDVTTEVLNIDMTTTGRVSRPTSCEKVGALVIHECGTREGQA